MKNKNSLLPIGERLSDDLKDNQHMTEHPMFCLQVLHREIGYDPVYSDNECWHDTETMDVVYDDDSETQRKDLGFNPVEDFWGFDETPEGWDGPFGYKDSWRTVMVSLTQKGIDDYMLNDGHNVKRIAFRGKTRTYVETFRRCDEMIEIRNALIEMADKNDLSIHENR